MGRAFRESQEAYERGDGAEAKRLSDKGKALREKRERLHREAANWIYEQNNKGRTDEEVDLHGLRAEEAVERTEAAVGRAREKGMTELRLIVGAFRFLAQILLFQTHEHELCRQRLAFGESQSGPETQDRGAHAKVSYSTHFTAFSLSYTIIDKIL